MVKKVFKIIAVLLVLVGLLGSGTYLYQRHRVTSLLQRVQDAKTQRAEHESVLTAADDTQVATAPADQVRSVDARPETASAPKLSARATACTERYEKYIDNQKFSEAIPTILDQMEDFLEGDLENDPCVLQLTEVLDLDHFQELFQKCESGKLLTDESKRACFTLVILGWGAFAETEFPDADPAAMPADALHSKIMFRLVEKERFLKAAGPKEKEYLFRLMDHMHKTNSKIDYGTTREELIADLYKSHPTTWKDEYSRVLEEMEDLDIVRAVMTFYKGHGGKMDQEFLNYVDDLTKRNPDSQIAHFYKSCAYTGVRDWEGALRELAEVERLAPKLNKELLPPLKEAIARKHPYIYITTWVSIATDMPDA